MIVGGLRSFSSLLTSATNTNNFFASFLVCSVCVHACYPSIHLSRLRLFVNIVHSCATCCHFCNSDVLTNDTSDLWHLKCLGDLVMGCTEADRSSTSGGVVAPVPVPVPVPAPVPVPVPVPAPVPVPVPLPVPVPVVIPAVTTPAPVMEPLPAPVTKAPTMMMPKPAPVMEPLPTPVIRAPTMMDPVPAVAPFVSQCQRHPGCALLNLTGLCCPTTDEIMLDCCTEIPDGIEQGSNATHWWWKYNSTTTTYNTTMDVQTENVAAIEAASLAAPVQALFVTVVVATASSMVLLW